MFGTKSKSWEYENEIRLIYSTSKRKGYNPFALKSIYFILFKILIFSKELDIPKEVLSK